MHALIQDGFENAHEGSYLHRAYYDLPVDSLIDMPLLFSFSDSIYLAVTEAALLDYAGMYLVKTRVLVSSPNCPRIFPGRVML